MAQQVGNSELLRTWANNGTVVVPSNAKIDEGWLRGEQPPHEWMNYIHNALGQKVNHMLSRGAPDWNSGTQYGAGALVNHNGFAWVAQATNDDSEPSVGNADWLRIATLDALALASQAEAEAGTDNEKLMTPLRVAQAIDQLQRDIASQAQAETGTDNEKIMTPLRVFQQITNRIASQAEAEAGIDNEKLMTPLRIAQVILANPYLAKPIGEPFPLWSHYPSFDVPDNSGDAKFIRLTAGFSGAGEYNEGLLTDETVTGSAPLIEATAEIMVGPLAGQRVPLINTEGSFLRAGINSGELQFDQMQRITGAISQSDVRGFTREDQGVGALVAGDTDLAGGVVTDTGGTSRREITLDTSLSPNARTSNTTSGETRPKNRQARYFMRIA